MTVLLREAIGDRLRHARTTQHRTLREVSRAARVSLGYLSEVERGRKEASSELLAAICDALDLPLSDLLHLVAEDVTAVSVPMHTVDDVTAPAIAGATDGVDDRALARGSEASIEGGRMVPAVVGTDLTDLHIQPALSRRLTTSLTSRAGGITVAA